MSSVVQEITYSKEHGAPCSHKKYDNERKKEQLDRLKPILVITKVEMGSDMYRQGFRWTQYFDFDGRQNAVTNMVPFFFKMSNVIHIPHWPFSKIRMNFYVNNCSFLYIIIDLNQTAQVLGQTAMEDPVNSSPSFHTTNKVKQFYDV